MSEVARPPVTPAPLSHGLQPCHRALVGELPLKLRQGAEEVNGQAALCDRCVDAFRKRCELCAFLFQGSEFRTPACLRLRSWSPPHGPGKPSFRWEYQRVVWIVPMKD